MLLAERLGDQTGLQAPTQAFAPTSDPCAESFSDSLPLFISNVIGFLTLLAGLMFLIYFIFAALSWVTSGGDKGKVESAKNQMTQGAIGLVIIIAAYSIVGIVGRVLGVDILNPINTLQNLGAPGECAGTVAAPGGPAQ